MKRRVELKPNLVFHVSEQDLLLAGLIYWAEVQGSTERLRSIQGLADTIKNKLPKVIKRQFRDWTRRPGFGTAMNVILSQHKYIRSYVWKKYFQRGHFLAAEIADAMGYQGDNSWEESVMLTPGEAMVDRLFNLVNLRVKSRVNGVISAQVFPYQKKKLFD